MAAAQIRFGTDGWRAVIAEDYTFENVRYCAQGWADYLKAHGLAERGCVVGFDTRFESEDFAAAAAEVLAGNGIKALLCERAEPTPVISYGIIERKAAGGITITASHNPAAYNGFKVRSDYGGAIAPEVISELEGRIDAAMSLGPSAVSRMPKDDGVERGLIEPFDPATPYVEHIRDLIDWQPIKDAGLKVVHDAMYGAGIGWFESLLAGGKTQVIQIDGVRNPYFGGLAPEPVPRNLQALFDAVRREGAAVGFATDGDSDRLGVCDERGNIVDQLRTYSLLALYLLEVRGFRGPIVKALNSSSMLDRIGQIYDVPVIETAIGFKYVAPAMMESSAMIGGEESGGYAFRNHIPERDGIVAGLFLLDFMIKTGKTPSQLVEYLFDKVGPHYYDRLDLHFDPRERDAILTRLRDGHPAKLAGADVAGENTTDGFKFTLDDGSWLLVRFSGTEPIMRVYTETTSPDRVQRILKAGRELAGV